jgi:hypothetical protein
LCYERHLGARQPHDSYDPGSGPGRLRRCSAKHCETRREGIVELAVVSNGSLARDELNGNLVSGFADLPRDTHFHFNSKGADAFLLVKLKAVADVAFEHLLVFFQWKFSASESSESYTHYSSLSKTLAGRPELLTAFLEERLCFVLLGMRKLLRLTDKQFNNTVDDLAKNKELNLVLCKSLHLDEVTEKAEQKRVLRRKLEDLVAKSLVVVSKAHAKVLAGPTLGSLTQFASVEKK